MRETSEKLTTPTRILRTVLISSVAGIVAAAAIFIAAYVAFPLKGVAVSGATMISESGIEKLVSSRTSLLTLNAASLEEEIENNPWVRSANVERNWKKNEAVVEVDERKPTLKLRVDGEDRVLASDGTVLPGDGGAALPVVEAEDWRIPGVLAAARVLEEGGAELDSIDSVGAGGITATISGRRVLLSDSVEVEQVDSLEDVMRENPAPAVFDLRSPGRIVVSEPDDVDRAEQREPENKNIAG